LKLLEKNIGKILENICISNTFLSETPVAQEIRAGIDKWDCIKLKSICIAKETISKTTYIMDENLCQQTN
jgi:hypothetical protein